MFSQPLPVMIISTNLYKKRDKVLLSENHTNLRWTDLRNEINFVTHDKLIALRRGCLIQKETKLNLNLKKNYLSFIQAYISIYCHPKLGDISMKGSSSSVPV